MANSSSNDVFQALELLARANEPLTLGSISRRMKIPLSSAFRIVATLQNAGLIEANSMTSGYVIGRSIHRLIQALFNRFKIRRISYPFLQQLAQMTGETCCLSVPIGWYCVRILSVRGMNEVVLSPSLGEPGPLGTMTAGRAILAFQSQGSQSLYRKWANETGAPLDKSTLSELAATRERGYSIEISRDPRRNRAVAFPILLHGASIGSISIEGPIIDPSKKSGRDVKRWKELCARINGLAEQNPNLFRNPFAHIQPAEICLHN